MSLATADEYGGQAMELEGGVAIVTGAGGGIGSEIARRLGDEGMSLVLADRNRASLQAAADSVSRSVSVVTAVGDVGDQSHHAGLVAAAEDLGGLAVSIQNAGVHLTGLTWEVPLEQWELQVRVNYWGVVHGVRAAMGVMAGRNTGHIMAVASGAGLVAAPGMAPYVSSKHAVVGLMESLRHELDRAVPGVRASVVCPGNVRTPMAANSLAAAGIDEQDLSPVARAIDDSVRVGNDDGQDASTVADAVVEGLRSGRFWVLPQPEVGLGALDRFQRLADGREPVDLLG